jgi:hypothetical protein
MPVSMSVRTVGVDSLVRRLNRLRPNVNPRWVSKALTKSALLGQKIAAEEEIKRGGRVRVGSRMTSAAAIGGKLTSRSGRLRASLRANRGQDKSGLPRHIDFGTDVKYGAVHEGDKRNFEIPRHEVAAHTRTMAFGRRTAPFEVGAYRRGPYSASFPRRPFLEPALDKAVLRMPDLFVKEWEREVTA